jgi:hypothetical protein
LKTCHAIDFTTRSTASGWTVEDLRKDYGEDLLVRIFDKHEVKLGDFMKWLERAGGSPREVSDRHRVRSILGMAVSR